MKKTLSILLILLFTGTTGFAQINTIWEKSQNEGNYPSFMGEGSTERGFAFGSFEGEPVSGNWELTQAAGTYPAYMGDANTERGFAYGNVGGQDRIFLVSRKDGTFIYIIDADNGDNVGSLDMTNVTGGIFPINDAEVSDDGIIFGCNLAVDATAHHFKVYRWDNESGAPVNVIDYTDEAIRLGDKFSVSGSASDNSLIIWAAGSGSDKVVKFTTADNGMSFTPELISLDNGAMGSSATVALNGDGTEFYINASGNYIERFNSDGTVIDTLSGDLVATGSNAIKYFESNGHKYVVTYNYNGTLGNENLRVVDVTGGLSAGQLAAVTPTIGDVGNPNGVGDCDVKDNGDGTFELYILGTNNGMASYTFDPAASGASDKIYLVSRNGGTFIYIIDAANGDSLGTLDMTGVAGGTYTLNDAEVSDDGIVFACNLAVDASASMFKVYRWNNDLAAPIPVVEYQGLAMRFGDKFSVTGSVSDNSVIIWAMSSNGDKLVKFTTTDNGMTFTPEEITLSNGIQGGSASVFPNMDNSELYTNSNGFNVQRFMAGGNVIDTLSGSVVATGSNAIKYFATADRKFIVTYNYNGTNGNENLRVVDVTAGLASGALAAITNTLGTVANGNGVGDCDVKNNGDGTFNLYILGTNNGLAAYEFTPPNYVENPVFDPVAGTYYQTINVTISTITSNASIHYTLDGADPDENSPVYSTPIELSANTTVKAIAYADGMEPSEIVSADYMFELAEEVNTIAEFRAGTPGTKYKINGEVILTFQQSWRGQKFVQDATGALLIDDDAGKISTEYQVGEGITGLIGELAEYGGMIELKPVSDPGAATSTANVVDPVVLTVADFNTNFEDYESELVNVEGVSFVDADGTVAFENGTIYKVTDGTDTLEFRTTFYDVDYIGTIIPEGGLNIVGLPNSRSEGDYLTARDLADLGILPPDPDSLYTYWAKNDANGSIPSYFGANTERSLSYGNVAGNERVYVVTRNNGPRIAIHDANTGAYLAEMAAPEPAVGYFPLNCVDVSDDGIIYACNMTLNGLTANFTVYRWDDESATPVVAGEVSAANRIGDMFSVYGRADDNSLVIYAGINPGQKFIKFTTSDNGVSLDPEVIEWDNLNQGTNPNFAQAEDGTVYAKSYGDYVVHYNPDGSVIDTIPGNIIATAASKIDYMKFQEREYILAYYADVSASGEDEYVAVVDVTGGDANASVAMKTPQLGFQQNLNASGGISTRMYDDDTFIIYALGGNNGIGAYSNDPDLITDVEPEADVIPEQFTLNQNYPNPFNPSTTISFALTVDSHVNLTVYNVLGQQVAKLVDGDMSAGLKKFDFNAASLASGMYLYKVDIKGNDGSEFSDIKKMLLLK